MGTTETTPVAADREMAKIEALTVAENWLEVLLNQRIT